MKLSIALVDDHKLFRDGLKLLLSQSETIETVYTFENGPQFLDFLRVSHPDVVLMDIDMPVMDGIEATQKALQLVPTLKVVALSMYSDEDYYAKMMDAGARGFLLKNTEITEVEKAIEYASQGKSYFSQEIMEQIITSINKPRKPYKLHDLTEREVEILFHICKGLSNQEIADNLFLSKRTVDKHRENILLKTESKNTAGLVMYAIRNHIIQMD